MFISLQYPAWYELDVDFFHVMWSFEDNSVGISNCYGA